MRLWLGSGRRAQNRRVSRQPRRGWVRPAAEQLEDRTLLSAFYTLDLIAKTGQAGLSSILQDASINDAGKVAFVGQYQDKNQNPAGEGVFVGDGSSLNDITFTTDPTDPNRTFGPAVQINNSDQVAVVDRYTDGGNTEWRLRTWDADGHINSFGNYFYPYATASSPPIYGYNFDALAGSVSLSNNGYVAYEAFDYKTNQWQLRLQNDTLPDPLDLPATTLNAPQSLRPMAANSSGPLNLQYVVVRNGSTSSSPIVLYQNVARGGAPFPVTIASAGSPNRFSALGQSPGISDDGQIVVFYGVDASGPGIFASVNTASHGRQIVRIASAAANGPISKFEPDVRVGVNSTETTEGAVTVTYVAYDAHGSKGVYASRLTFVPPANAPTNFSDPTSFVVSDPIPVLQAGDTVPGLGTVQDVNLYDPINNTGFGQIAIWANTSGGEGIVRASSPGLAAVANSVKVQTGTPLVAGGIGATFQPAQGSMTMAQADAALGIDHFNWVQQITTLPSTWTAYIADQLEFTDPGHADDRPKWAWNPVTQQLDHEGNSQLPDGTPVELSSNPLPIGDPIQNVLGSHSNVFYDSASNTWFAWGWGGTTPPDNLPGYWNEPTELANHTTTSNLTFFDAPIQPDGTIPAGESLAFMTMLVGVRADGTLLQFPNGLGTSFTWKSNTTSNGLGSTGGVSDIGFSYNNINPLPAISSGGVFDVQADNAPPPTNDLVLTSISNQAATPGSPVTFTASATDPFPGAMVTFSLASDAPIGATIDPSTGVFSWTPTAAQAGQVYSITVNATDNSTPVLTATQSFIVDVQNKLEVTEVTELAPPAPGPLQVAVDFNEALQPSVAQNVALYKIAQEGASRLPIQSAVYSDNGTQHRVVLTVTTGTKVIPGFYHVLIDAANLAATNGDQGEPKADQLWVDVTSENALKPITVQPDGSFAVSGPGQFLGYAPPQQVIAGDFTGSPYADLVVLTNSAAGPNSYPFTYADTQLLLLKNNGDGTYAPPVPIPVGQPGDVIEYVGTVDWNHDGSPDLVVGTANAPFFPSSFFYYVLLNDGHGNFTNAPETPIPVAAPQVGEGGANPPFTPFQATALFDLMGTGQPQILHLGPYNTSTNDYNLEVIGKDPNLGYTPRMELELPGTGVDDYPTQVTFSDLNGDGRPDIIAALTGYGGGGLDVILSTPTGYATGQSIGAGAFAVGVGNFSGDGKDDVAAVTTEGVQIYRNDGGGNFTAPDLPIVFSYKYVRAAAFADLNHDGIPDLVVIIQPLTPDGAANDEPLSVWTLMADGHGGFAPTTPAPIPIAGSDMSIPTSMTLADVDGDGNPGVVLGSNSVGEIRIAINDGTGTMRPPAQPLPFLGQPVNTLSAYGYPGVAYQVFADFNNSGHPGFVTISPGEPGAVDVYVGQSDGAFKHTDSLPIPGEWGLQDAPTWVKVGDLNNDGIPDILFGDGARMAVYLGNGDGTFRQAPTFLYPASATYGSIHNVTLADVNNDGNLDVVTDLGADFGIFFGDGKGDLSFNANTLVPISLYQPGQANPAVPVLDDFNRDGRLDLLVPTNSNGTLADYLGNGNGTFSSGPIIYSGANPSVTQTLVGDLNGDGIPDIVNIPYSDAKLGSYGIDQSITAQVFLGNGDGSFRTAPDLDLTIGANGPNGVGIGPVNVVLGDFNGDGKLDLASSFFNPQFGADQVAVYSGDGTGHFSAPQFVTVGLGPFTLVSIPRAPFLDAGSFAVTDQPPTAKNETPTAFTGGSITIPVLDDATDPDGAPLTITGVSSPGHGVAHVIPGPPNNLADEAIVYTPAAGFTGTDTFTYTIADPAGVESTATATVTVVPVPVLQFSAATYTANDSDGSVTITVTRTGGTGGTATVNYATSDGTATAGQDYTATSGTLTFNPGETSKSFAVPILNNGRVSGSETVNLALSRNFDGSVVGAPGNAVLTIFNGASQSGPLEFSAANYGVTESPGTATVTVTRSGGSSGTVTVNYATSNGTAVGGTDYTATTGTLTFAPGVLSQTFSVPILSDGRSDGSETVNLALSSPGGGATLGTQATAVLTITDPSAQAGQVAFNAGTYNVTESGGSATITVLRTGGSAGAVTVDYATSNGTAVAGRDYTATTGTLTFNSGETSKSFVVPILIDPGATGSQAVLLTLINPGGGASLGAPSTALLVIADNVTSGGGTGGGGSGPVGGSPAITAQLVTVKVRKKKVLMVEVFFADTGAKKELLPSPFQKGRFRHIQVSVRGNQVVLTAKKGKKTVTATLPG
jgi:hypothetical protein